MKITSSISSCVTLNQTERERSEFFRIAVQLMKENQHQMVFDETAKVLADRPDDAELWNLLGVAASVVQGLEGAAIAFQRAVELKPDYLEAKQNYATTLVNLHRLTEAIAAYRQLFSLSADPAHYSALLFLLQKTETDPHKLFEAHLEFGRLYGGGDRKSQAFKNVLDPERKLRVGYVSGDLREHSVAFFIEPILAHHDHDQFEIHAFSNGRYDHVSTRLQKLCDHWHDTTRLSDEQLFRLIRKLRIDVLVDLAGHTGLNRLPVFGRRAAPVQITWFGYMATTGLKEMDYRLTDQRMSSPESHRFYTEELYSLPGLVVWSPAPEAPPVSPPPCLHNGHITFASLNNFSKISGEVLDTWGQLLATVPSAVLIIVAKGAGTASFQQPVFERFARFQAAERLVFVEQLPLEQFLALFEHIDIALDPFPYNGGTTSMHTLWAGVPIVTMAGESEIERAGAAILSNVSNTDLEIRLTAHNPHEYIKIASTLATEPETLARWREDMRNNLRQSGLMDYSGRASQLQTAFRDMFARYCERVKNSSKK